MQTRYQTPKMLVPGLNKVFGDAYKRYDNEHLALFDIEKSNRAYEEEVIYSTFGEAPIKSEGAPVAYTQAQEGWTARWNHITVALAFAITEEAMEDNLYLNLSKRHAADLGRSMAHTKQVKAANVYNNAFDVNYKGGDGVQLCDDEHPLILGGQLSNVLNPGAELSEAALEQIMIMISECTDDAGIPAAITAQSLIIPPQLVFEAERILKSPYRVNTADNDINALNTMRYMPRGVHVNHRFTDPAAFFVRTDAPNSMKMFERVKLQTKSEGEFETGNWRYKARERYSFGWADWRGVYGSSGA